MSAVIPTNERTRALGLIADLERAGAVTAVSLVLPADTTRETWEAVIALLDSLEQFGPWAVGDGYAFGEAAYGEEAYDTEMRHLSSETVRNYTWVAQRIPAAERRVGLKFSHHQAVAALPKRERERWLDKAEQKGWKVRDLRAAMLAAKAVEPPEQPGKPAKPKLTAKEALTQIRQDETWREVASAALESLDEEREATCPKCGEVFAL